MNTNKFQLIKYIQIYLTTSVILYFIGPLNYAYTNVGIMLFFLLVYQFIFTVGYFIGYNNISVKKRNISLKFSTDLLILLLIVSTIIDLVFNTIEIIEYFGTINPISVISSFINSRADAGDLYKNHLERNSYTEGGVFTQLKSLLSPLTYLVIPLGIMKYKEIKPSLFRFIWFIVIVLNIMNAMMTGQSIGIFKIVISIVSTVYINQFINKSSSNPNPNQNKKSKLVRITIVILVTIFILLFMENVTSRGDNIGLYLGKVYINYDHWIFKIIPTTFHTGIIYVVSYLTQGYYGFSLLFDYSWIPTFPIGNSVFLMSYAGSFGINTSDILSKTYIYRMANEWSPTVNWHTTYTWFANDVSVIGVVLVMLIFGIGLGMIFKNAQEGNTLSTLIFGLLMISVCFIPMNNFIFSNPLTFIPFWVYLVIFILNYKINLVRKL